MAEHLVTLTTDFGNGSPYVACMKGVLWSVNPNLNIVDISHSIRPQDIRQGAYTLEQAVPHFPVGTYHLAVIDPGVGSQRELLYADISGQHLIAPDNGLVSWLAERGSVQNLRHLKNDQFWQLPVSSTFHGRDIMASTLAHLTLGARVEDLGPQTPHYQKLNRPIPKRIRGSLKGEVIAVDSFGNLITNIERLHLTDIPKTSVRILVDHHETTGIFNTYSDVEPHTLIALVGSNQHLEIAVTQENASELLGVRVGMTVELLWESLGKQ
ncbi:MAG: SAM-dependent chlorinase/fluorinase [Planctomycetota bacterium]|nr:SAM-dependent chlorinase/fluorinase [Planctomycetota bacterium]